MRTKLFAAALLLAATPVAAQAMTFSAIALSPRTGAYGYAYDQPTPSAANFAAMANCRARSGHWRDCRVVQWTRGNFCAALVLHHTGNGSVGWGVGSARSEGDAKSIAWRECNANNNGECEELAAVVCSH